MVGGGGGPRDHYIYVLEGSCLHEENVLKMITVFENFDFLDTFSVMGEKYRPLSAKTV